MTRLSATSDWMRVCDKNSIPQDICSGCQHSNLDFLACDREEMGYRCAWKRKITTIKLRTVPRLFMCVLIFLCCLYCKTNNSRLWFINSVDLEASLGYWTSPVPFLLLIFIPLVWYLLGRQHFGLETSIAPIWIYPDFLHQGHLACLSISYHISPPVLDFRRTRRKSHK